MATLIPPTPLHKEDHISEIPALQLLQNLGYTYLMPEEALAQRGGRRSNVLLEGVLAEQLRRSNVIRFKGRTHAFSEGNIQSAVQSLKDVVFDGLVRTNEKVYDLLRLGQSLTQIIDGNTKSFPLRYFDWEHPERNVYHVTDEFAVERTASTETRRPDLVLFVNGIPLVVIECKRSDLDDPIGEAVSQQIRNQKDDHIPHLFLYAQLLLALAKNEARYATAGTPREFWAVWKERENVDAELRELVNRPLSRDEQERVFSTRPAWVRREIEALAEGGREVTEQDRTLYALCRPERLLELTAGFIVFEKGEKKIARYQQYFCVKKTMERLRHPDAEGRRQGGIVWHTQGSGKSLTMVMLAAAIAREAD
jgi:type I restriction enzyme, R subunit